MKRSDELLSSFDLSWKEFSAAWKKAHRKSTEKSIHDLRVSARRLIATMELTRSLSKHAEIPKLQRRFKKVLKRMGPLRDVQVQLQGVSRIPRKTDLILEFKESLERRERREIDSIHDELKGTTKRKLTKGVKDVRSEFIRLHKASGEEKIHRGVERLLRIRRNEFMRARKRFQPSDEETLHEMRIALKKLRYVVEAAQPVLGNAARRDARAMHSLQGLLGDTRDAELLRTELEKWAVKRGKKLAVVPVLDALQQQREALMRKIMGSSKALDAIAPTNGVKPVVEKTQAADSSGSGSLAVPDVVSLN